MSKKELRTCLQTINVKCLSKHVEVNPASFCECGLVDKHLLHENVSAAVCLCLMSVHVFVSEVSTL